MKGILLILSLVLSCMFSGSGICREVAEEKSHDAIVECSDSQSPERLTDINDLAILPVRTATFSANGNTPAPTVRSINAGRRAQPSYKATLFSFRATILQFPSGTHTNSRYIHSICHLLI